MTKKKLKRIDPGANENPMPPVHDELGVRLAENAIATATSGDEPAEYKDDVDREEDEAIMELGEAGIVETEAVETEEDELVVPPHR